MYDELKSFVRIRRNFKAKMALNNKEWRVKTCIHKSAIKISIIHSQHHSLPFSSIKMLCTKKLKFDNPFRIQFTIQEIAFRLCTKQSAGGKSKKDKGVTHGPGPMFASKR